MKTDIGVGLKPPKNKCEDLKCPWHGSIPLRGSMFDGIVKTAKSQSTAVIQWEYNLFIKKYERSERRKGRINAHNPLCVKANKGDKVRVAECRPLSKTKSFVIVGIL